MKNPFRPATTLAKIEKQIREFDTQRSELAKKQTVIEKIQQEKAAELRGFVREHPSEDPPAELRHAVAMAREHHCAIIESIAECESQLSDLRGYLKAEQERAQREDVAGTLERAADAAEQVSKELGSAVGAVAEAITKLRAAIPPNLATHEADSDSRPYDRSGGTYGSAEELASALLGEILFEQMPELFDRQPHVVGSAVAAVRIPNIREIVLHRMNLNGPHPRSTFVDGVPTGLPAEEAIKVFTKGWRDRAEWIRSGEIAADLGIIEYPQREEASPNSSETQVMVTKKFRYVGEKGRRSFCDKWSYHLPNAIAHAAIATGYAVAFDSPEGQEAYSAEREARERDRERGVSEIVDPLGSLSEYADLGNPLGVPVIGTTEEAGIIASSRRGG